MLLGRIRCGAEDAGIADKGDKKRLLGDESMSGIAARGRASPGCRRQRWRNKALRAAAQRMEAPPIAASLLAMATDGQQGGRTPQR